MKGLLEFWRRQGRLSKIVLIVGAVLVVGYGISIASGGSDDDTTTTTTTMTTAEAADGDPISCLEDLDLSSVEERSSDTWRGFNDAPFYGIIVHLLPSEAEARQAVADAVDVYAAQAGSYAVTGPFKAGLEGAGLSADEGVTADNQVQAVAVCLGG